ncbi:MAG: hypothetical protein K2J93_06315 [Anaeroplasmataceae bacterium]|nr:hypothetical protein [Anaeroplasmataceae bacterium]
MKKFILALCVLLGLVSLTACDDDATIRYVNDKGEETTLNVYATDDKETVQAVLNFASQAKYDDVTSFTLKQSASISASFSKDAAAAFPELAANSKVSGHASMAVNASEKDGLDVSVSGDLSLSKNEKASFKADVLYEGALEAMYTSEEYLYVNASYDVTSPSNTSKGEVKQAVDPMTVLDEMEDDLEDIFSKFLPTDVPSMDDPNSFTVEEFYDTFKNSKLAISKVKNGVIYIDVVLYLKDILLQGDKIEHLDLKTLLMLNSDFTFSFGVEASTGRLCEFSFVYDDAKTMNLLLSMLLGKTCHEMEATTSISLIDTFRVEGKLTIEYNKAKIRTLSVAEKAKYALAA